MVSELSWTGGHLVRVWRVGKLVSVGKPYTFHGQKYREQRNTSFFPLWRLLLGQNLEMSPSLELLAVGLRVGSSPWTGCYWSWRRWESLPRSWLQSPSFRGKMPQYPPRSAHIYKISIFYFGWIYIYRGIKEKEMVLLKAFFFNIAAQNLSRSFRGNFHFYVINWLIKKDSSKMQTLWWLYQYTHRKYSSTTKMLRWSTAQISKIKMSTQNKWKVLQVIWHYFMWSLSFNNSSFAFMSSIVKERNPCAVPPD